MRFDRGSRALYATDGSNYRQIPIGLVVPRDADDVVAAVAACRKFGAPVLPRGAGTSLAGQCCNVAVVLDFTKYMNRILEIDPVQRFARVQPGVVLDTLRNRSRGASPDVRTRSVNPQPLHARRDDRQQLLRHALAAGRQDRRQRRRAEHPALRRHATDRRHNGRPRARRDRQRRADAAAKSTPGCGGFEIDTRRRYASAIRTFPEESPATTSTSSCRSEASTLPGRLSGPKGRARLCSKPS